MKKTKTTLLAAVTLALSAGGSVYADKPSFSADQNLIDIQNTCIVRLKDNVSNVRGLANAMAKRANGNLKHVYQNSIKGFAVNVPCAAAYKAFGGDSNIQSIEPDSPVFAMPRGGNGKPGGGGSTPPPQQTPYGTTRVGGPVDGSGFTAWVIDSGIDIDHADLNVDNSRGFSAFSKGKDAGNDDGNGHGTHVAGTIGALNNSIGSVGVAAGATVIPVKVLGARGSGSTSGVIAGVDHVGDNASAGDCANMSLGGGFSQALNDAVIAAAARSGAFFVVAAGNESQNTNNVSPGSANGTNVFTISSMDSNDNWSSFSNFANPPVDYVAPGSGVYSTYKSGGYATLSGTSMASPHACAVLMMTGGNPNTDGTVNGDPDGNPDPIITL